MKIFVTPTCIVERALWNKFAVHVLPKMISKKQGTDAFLLENKEFELKEADALVIGLLKCIETDNLSHRLNNMLNELLMSRSVEIEVDDTEYYMIRKKLVVSKLVEFRNNFPKEWKPNGEYKLGLADLMIYIDFLLEKVETLKIHTIDDKGIMVDYLYYNNVKKLMKVYN